MKTTLIFNVRLASEPNCNAYLLIEDDKIKAVGHYDGVIDIDCDIKIDGQGALLMPGAIDCHVHFREPGMTEKADIASESRAAVAGGVSSYLEMPNTKPATTTIGRWEEKMQIAAKSSVANYAFFIGATNDNIDELKKADYTRVPGVKMFMGSSTGNMLVDDDSTISCVFTEVDALVAVHAEDQGVIDTNTKKFKGLDADDLPIEYHTYIRSAEACFESSKKAVKLALEHNHRLHLCHLSTAIELSLLSQGDPGGKLITSEVSPHHLMWTDQDYHNLGSRIKMNPAVKSDADCKALRQAVESGLIDIVATDHAPHLLSQKQGGALKAVSGAPLVQFSLPWMLTNFDELTVQRVMCENPAKTFSIELRGALEPGYYADFTLIKEADPYLVCDDDVISKCGWTPLSGYQKLRYRVAQTWVNGRLVYDNGAFTGAEAAMPLRFAPHAG